jgi:hypothetical protein
VRPPKADIDISKVILSGPKMAGKRSLAAQVQGRITGSSVETTIEGASTLTLTITDWSRALVHNPLIAGPVQVTFDGEEFVLTKVAKADTTITLTFEDRAVNLLRQYSKPKKADRAHTTRAQFVRSMAQEVKEATIDFVCPEISTKQPIAKPSKVVVRTRTKR